MNPVWSLCINLSRKSFILSAIYPDAILYTTFKREIGLQFFRNCLGFPAFVIQVITPNLLHAEKLCFSYELLIALVTKEPIS